ncbi:MAG: hypothetical protein RBS87_08130, partial [Acholeplasma sp.]|nr:hypothetical protein [Acholeplasma sp.]
MNKSKSNMLNVLKIVGNVLFYTLIVLLLLFSISNLSVKTNKDVANIFGRGFLPVISDSMEGNNSDSFDKGSLVFVKLLSESQKEELEIGDIVTFYDLNLSALNTHRVVYVTPSYIVTQGDKAAASAPYVIGGDNTGVQYEIVTYDNIKAIRTGDIGGVGSAVSYLQTPT